MTRLVALCVTSTVWVGACGSVAAQDTGSPDGGAHSMDASVSAMLDAASGDAGGDGGALDAEPVRTRDAGVKLDAGAPSGSTVDVAAPAVSAPVDAGPRKPPRTKQDDWTTSLPEVPGNPFVMLLVAGLALFLAGAARRAREALPADGLIPLAVSTAHIGLQLLVVVMALTVAARLLPSGLEPAVPWVIVGGALAVGWSARELLTDLLGALVIAFERRVRPGTWISGPDYAGLVERRGLRAVWIRDGHGNRLAVPNRHVVGTTVTMQVASGPVHEVAVRLRTKRPSREVRAALREATLISPWVRSEASPQIRQNGNDPELWHVRAHLLELRFATVFEGDLIERAADSLARSAAAVEDDWD